MQYSHSHARDKRAQELEDARLQLERERLELEKEKAATDQKFLNRNLGTVITAVVSLAAVLVSGAQVWVATISKDREMEITRAQQNRD